MSCFQVGRRTPRRSNALRPSRRIKSPTPARASSVRGMPLRITSQMVNLISTSVRLSRLPIRAVCARLRPIW